MQQPDKGPLRPAAATTLRDRRVVPDSHREVVDAGGGDVGARHGGNPRHDEAGGVVVHQGGVHPFDRGDGVRVGHVQSHLIIGLRSFTAGPVWVFMYGVGLVTASASGTNVIDCP